MLFVLRPQTQTQATSSRPVYFDPEEAFLEYKRREYVAALEEQQQRAQFERELALEQERHRRALATIKAQEAARRRQQAFSSYSPYSVYGVHPAQASKAQAQAGAGCGAGARFCRQPAPEEILRRRAARQQEEERLSRQFHEHILSQIFGIPVETSEESATPVPEAAAQPEASTSAKGKGKETANAAAPAAAAPKRTRFEDEATEPHWSAAPERAQSLAEISSINRNFVSLKNTFAFPTGELQAIKGSDVPRLAFNEVNASIHAYDHALSELLTRLDGVESHGFKGVREARKQLVVKIEKELEELEKKIAERLAGNASPAAPFVSIPVEGSSAPSSPSATTSTSTVVPAVPTSPVLAPAAVVANKEDDIVMDYEPEVQTQRAEKTLVGGYDIEFEDDYEAATGAEEEPKVAETVSEPVAEQSNEQVAIEVDQEEPQQEQPSVPSTETVPTPAPIEASISTPTSPVAQEAVHTAVLAEAEPVSTSDEESEIEDAVHIEISSDEENVHASDKDDHHSDEDGAFEML